MSNHDCDHEMSDRMVDARCNVFGHDFDADGDCGFCDMVRCPACGFGVSA